MRHLRARQLLQRHVDDDAFTGAGLVVWQDGATIAEHYLGDAAPGLRSSGDVLWPIASISKVYTAAVIMRLVEEGVVTLNMPVHLTLGAFTGGMRDEVRLRHLLTHTSGLIYESPDMEARLASQTPLHALREEAMQSDLLFRPGTEVSYADYNSLVAAHVAETASGVAFPELMRSYLLEPAGLGDTRFPPCPDDDDRTALVRGVPAEGTAGAMYNSRYARALAHPAFGICATTEDLAHFGTLFLAGGPRVLAPATIRVMTTDQTGGVPGHHPSMQGYAADARVPWAIGFALQTERTPGLYSDLASPRTFGHGGASGCELVCDPDRALVVALTTNTHLRTGRDAWTRRLQSVLNVVFAECG